MAHKNVKNNTQNEPNLREYLVARSKVLQDVCDRKITDVYLVPPIFNQKALAILKA